MAETRGPNQRRLDLLGAAGALIGVGAIAFAAAAVSPVAPSLWWISAGLTVLAVASSVWMMRQPTRVIWDPSTPVMMASGVIAGPIAPLVVVIQAWLIALAGARRQGLRLALTNAGLLSVRWIIVGFGFRLIPEPDRGVAELATVAAGVVLLTALGIAANSPLTAAGIRFLYGSWPSWDDMWRNHAIEIGSALVLAPVAWLAPTVAWISLPGIVAAALFAVYVAGRYREHVVATMLELQARVVSFELHGPNVGHTERVVAAVRRHADHLSPSDGEFAELAAWFHSLAFGGSPNRCHGVPHTDELHLIAGALPRVKGHRILSIMGGTGFVTASSSPMAELLAAACAWDSRKLPASPVTDPDDLIYTFGVGHDLAEKLTRDDFY